MVTKKKKAIKKKPAVKKAARKAVKTKGQAPSRAKKAPPMKPAAKPRPKPAKPMMSIETVKTMAMLVPPMPLQKQAAATAPRVKKEKHSSRPTAGRPERAYNVQAIEKKWQVKWEQD